MGKLPKLTGALKHSIATPGAIVLHINTPGGPLPSDDLWQPLDPPGHIKVNGVFVPVHAISHGPSLVSTYVANPWPAVNLPLDAKSKHKALLDVAHAFRRDWYVSCVFHAIAERLPRDFPPASRRHLAELLAAAEFDFEHDLSQVASKHRLATA